MSFNVAIDGPAGAGKSTVAKAVAAKRNFIYVDTGAMYRTMALYFLRKGVDKNDEAAVNKACMEVSISIAYENGAQQVFLNGENVSGLIRTEEVGNMASAVSGYMPVREKLVELQKQLAAKENVIMDGRDIGTVVLPKAEVKIYLNAHVEERAKRRLKEFELAGKSCSLEEVIEQIKVRDHNDMTREYNPLRKADDAVEIDTTGLTVDEVADKVLEVVEEKTGEI